MLALIVTAMPASAQAGGKRLRFILNGPALQTFTTNPTAVSFFAGSRPFVVVSKKFSASRIPSSWQAVPTQIFTSYRWFQAAIKHGKIQPGVKAVIYDNEGWTLTPPAEQRNYAQFAQRFYELAHQHGFVVIHTPALSLANAVQAAGERRFDAFMRAGFWDDAVRYADAVDLQMQGSQVPASAYANFVKSAAQRARQANPHVLILAGISTNPSGHHVTAQQIVDAIMATRGIVDGYWFNVPQAGPSCPHCTDFRPDIALDVLRMLQARHAQ